MTEQIAGAEHVGQDVFTPIGRGTLEWVNEHVAGVHDSEHGDREWSREQVTLAD